jgi:hypothetical protein
MNIDEVAIWTLAAGACGQRRGAQWSAHGSGEKETALIDPQST